MWPDEAIYADIAYNFASEGRLGTGLWKGMVRGVENHAYFYPPVFFSSIALWFKLLGFSIANQRLLSVAAGFGFLVVFYFFSRLFFKNKACWYSVLPLGVLVVDFTFSRGSRVSRPEIFVLFFGLLSLYTFLIARQKNVKSDLKSVLLMASGLLGSLAFLNHAVGSLFFLSLLVYLLITEKLTLFKSKNSYLFASSFLAPIVLWLALIWPSLDILVEQVLLSLHVKRAVDSWIKQALFEQPLEIRIIYLIYISTTLTFIIFSRINQKRAYLFISIILVFAWLFPISGKLFWYFILPVPFIYLAFSMLLAEIHQQSILYKSLVAALLITSFFNLKLNAQIISETRGENYSYEKFVQRLLGIIPENRTVFLSSIPDPYFGFKTERRNKLYEFPALPTSQENYLNILDDSDFIVYNGLHEPPGFGNFLLGYIKENKSNLYLIGEASQYQAFIIELLPKAQRKNPSQSKHL